jgi:hypothetical protein
MPKLTQVQESLIAKCPPAVADGALPFFINVDVLPRFPVVEPPDDDWKIPALPPDLQPEQELPF